MFHGLLPPPPTTSTAYLELQKKLEEHRRKPHVQEFHRVCPRAALARIELLEDRIEKSLGWYTMWETVPDHRSSEIRLERHTNRIEEALVEIRILVRALTLRKVVRLIATVKIQKTCLRILYAPRPGQLPKISRSLLDEGLVGTGEFGTTLDNGDADDDG